MEHKTENQIPYNNYDKINIYLTGYGHFLTIEENPTEIISENNSPKKKYHHIYLIIIVN